MITAKATDLIGVFIFIRVLQICNLILISEAELQSDVPHIFAFLVFFFRLRHAGLRPVISRRGLRLSVQAQLG